MVFSDGLRVHAVTGDVDTVPEVKLCSLQHVRKLLRRDCAEAWLCTVRASMEDAVPTDSEPDVVPSKWDALCAEYADVFAAPQFP